MASLEHPSCKTWSCRYLFDWHALFSLETEPLPGTPPQYAANCRLCTFSVSKPSLEEVVKHGRQDLRDHAECHRPLTCSQDVFIDEYEFRQHMEAYHGALRLDTKPWQGWHWLEKDATKYVARTYFRSTDSMLCTREASSTEHRLLDPVSGALEAWTLCAEQTSSAVDAEVTRNAS